MKKPLLTKQEQWNFIVEASKLAVKKFTGELTEEEFEQQLNQLANDWEKQREEELKRINYVY